MKGNPKVIEALNKVLTVELTAINQYFVQAKMCRNWGYHKLAQKQYHEALEEMKHAEALIDRILFLEGTPNISRYGAIRVGKNAKEHFENDLELEMEGVKLYNESVVLCQNQRDAGSRELLEHILTQSEEHVDWLESQLHIIKEIGLGNYLTEQVGEDGDGKK